MRVRHVLGSRLMLVICFWISFCVISISSQITAETSPCPPGFFKDTECQSCPVGTCNEGSGATKCSECILEDFFCGGDLCDTSVLETPPIENATSSGNYDITSIPWINASKANVSILLPTFYQQKRETQYIYIASTGRALAAIFQRSLSPDWIRIISIDRATLGNLNSTNGTNTTNQNSPARVRPKLNSSGLLPAELIVQMKIKLEHCDALEDILYDAPIFESRLRNSMAPTGFTAQYDNCPFTGLSDDLKAKAAATTAVVASVVGAVVSKSVAFSMATSASAPMASGIAFGASGISIFQLISAAQFMNVFGSVLDKRDVQKNINRRPSKRVRNPAATFSATFGWANLRFDDIFALREDGCGGYYMQPFFGIFGTFVSTLGASFVMRIVLQMFMKKYVQRVVQDWPIHSLPGFRPGQYEFHVIKTSHLGLCQAAGSVISVAINRGPGCPCGWLTSAAWALAICWLVCLPIGLILFTALHFHIALKTKSIIFHRLKGAGEWTRYSNTVANAHGSAEDFCKPHVIFNVFKYSVSIAAILCIFMGLRSATMKVLVDSVVLFSVGVFLSFISNNLRSSIGRWFVVKVTNLMASSVGIVYVIHKEGVIEKVEESKGRRILRPVLNRLGNLYIKLEAAFGHGNLKLLRDRGRWLKKDSMKMFYVDCHKGGLYYPLFWMIKNVLLGVLLTGDPILVDPSIKAWVITGLYGAELIIHTFFSPDIDAFNGAKLAFQALQQFVIILIGALAVSGVISSDSGTNMCIQLSLIQVSLAIPEQLWGLLSSTLLKKKGAPEDPGFHMTAAELYLERQQSVIGIQGKVESAILVVQKLKEMKDSANISEGINKKEKIQRVHGLIVMVATDQTILVHLNRIKPGCLNVMLAEVFGNEFVQEALELLADNIRVCRAPLNSIKDNAWETDLDFVTGIADIHEVTTFIKDVADILKSIANLKIEEAIMHCLKCEILVACALGLNDEVELIDDDGGSNLLFQLFRDQAVQDAVRNVIEVSRENAVIRKVQRLSLVISADAVDCSDFKDSLVDLFSMDEADHLKSDNGNVEKSSKDLTENHSKKAARGLKNNTEQDPKKPGVLGDIKSLDIPQQIIASLDTAAIFDLFMRILVRQLPLEQSSEQDGSIQSDEELIIIMADKLCAELKSIMKIVTASKTFVKNIREYNLHGAVEVLNEIIIILGSDKMIREHCSATTWNRNRAVSILQNLSSRNPNITDAQLAEGIRKICVDLPKPVSGLVMKALDMLDLIPSAKIIINHKRKKCYTGVIEELLSPSLVTKLNLIAPGMMDSLSQVVTQEYVQHRSASESDSDEPDVLPLPIPSNMMGSSLSQSSVQHEHSQVSKFESDSTEKDLRNCIATITTFVTESSMALGDAVLISHNQLFGPGSSETLYNFALDGLSEVNGKVGPSTQAYQLDETAAKLIVNSIGSYIPRKFHRNLHFLLADGSAVEMAHVPNSGRHGMGSSKSAITAGDVSKSRSAHRGKIVLQKRRRIGPNQDKFVGLLYYVFGVVLQMDNEQCIRVIQEIEGALPEAAVCVTEDLFDVVYEIAATMEGAKGIVGSSDGIGDDPDGSADAAVGISTTKLDKDALVREGPALNLAVHSIATQKHGVQRGVVETLTKEPQWLVLMILGILGLASVGIFIFIASANDCGCTCPA